MLILANAKIYTQDPKQPKAEALAIQPAPENVGRIVAAGSLDQLQAEFPNAQVEDLGGRVVLPGLTDAHVHIRNYAHGLNSLACDTATRAECIERVRARAAASQAGAWIRGHGWRQNNWPEGFGSAALLDEAAPHNPVYLTAASLHAGWANSAALRAAGITAATTDPPNGQIQRDENGQPTGILFEEAQGLVEDAIPRPSAEEDIAAIQTAQTRLWSFGLTGVHDFDRLRSFAALQSLHGRGQLKLRVHKNLPVEALQHAIGIGLRSGLGDDLLRIGGIKVFADGALGPRTAAMVEPYAGAPNNRGMLFLDAEQLFEHAQNAARGGLKMTVHAIGDRANHEVLNAYEQLRNFERSAGLPALRHRIEHVQILHPDDLQRLGKLHIIASMQPIHATSDMQAADEYWGERSQYAYSWRTQLEAGAVLAFGSDAPVESPNPWLGIHAAVTRRRADGSPGAEGWYPQQRLTLHEALAGFTTGPAYAAGAENKLGRLAPGCLADLIVMEQDPFSIDAHELQHLLPSAVMLGGEWVLRN
jgi:predicted amidohydrolase YtcJ